MTGEIGLHATPIIAKDIIVVGAAHLEGSGPKSKKHEKGYVRGYDARTGKRLWIFHTIPSPGEFGNNTWEKDSWSYTGNAGVWAQMTIDEQLGMVYLPVELPTGDYYGGHRPGNGLFGESIVALDLKTGKRMWHYQFVHHGIWDLDIPCAPILADITSTDGKPIKAIAQPTKQALGLCVRSHQRQTGVADRRAVPSQKATCPAKRYSPTQPFLDQATGVRSSGRRARRSDRFHAGAACRRRRNWRRATRSGPIFTPPVVSKLDGPLGTLMLPSATGGANWQGGSLDPETSMLYVFSVTDHRRSVWCRPIRRSRLRLRTGILAECAATRRQPSRRGRGRCGGQPADAAQLRRRRT